MMTTIPGGLGRVLNLLGIIVVAYTVLGPSGNAPVLAVVATIVALLAWATVLVIPERLLLLPLVVMVVAGGLASVPTDGVVVVPVLVAVIRSIGSTTIPLWRGVALAALGVVLVPVGLLFEPTTALGLTGMEVGLVVAALGGFSRRQARIAEVRERELLRQQARGAALAERQTVARDIHDVLAHSLGGLVLQLDAIDAQLEAGRVTDAAARVRQARALAAEGLGEARRAVDALRDERSTPVTAAEFLVAVDDLVAAHRALGGSVELASSGVPHDLDGVAADALRRALQEALTNARKHAPGAAVTVRLRWTAGVELEVANDLGERPAGGDSGRGHGLDGMAERFDGIGSVTAAATAGRFVVNARVDA